MLDLGTILRMRKGYYSFPANFRRLFMRLLLWLTRRTILEPRASCPPPTENQTRLGTTFLLIVFSSQAIFLDLHNNSSRCNLSQPPTEQRLWFSFCFLFTFKRSRSYLLVQPVTIYKLTGSSQNFTLRFFQNSQDDSCDFGGSSQALTFTTSSMPVINHCFDFADLFGGNTTQGFVNQTRNLGSMRPGEAGIYYTLENVETYDPQGNYSSVLYHQHVANPTSDDYKPGHAANRRVTIYPGTGCSDYHRPSDQILPWFGFGCWSEDKGSCGTTPYSIASFSLQPVDDPEGSCWDFAVQGAASRSYSSSQAAMGALLGASLAIWLGA